MNMTSLYLAFICFDLSGKIATIGDSIFFHIIMRPIKQQDFPYHIGNGYSFARIDHSYNLSRIVKIIDLKSYLICAIDQQHSFHFIQHRSPYPNEVLIVPPSIAIQGTLPIKFSIEFYPLKSHLLKRRLTESDYVTFFADQGREEEGWPECTYLCDNRMAIKLSFDGPVFIVYIDERLDTEPPVIIDSLSNAIFIRLVSSSELISYKYEILEISLTNINTHKTKALSFGCKSVINDIQVLQAQRIAIVLYKNGIEALDIDTNCVMERAVFLECTDLKLSIEGRQNSGQFLCSYIFDSRSARYSKLILKIWRVGENNSSESSGETSLFYPAEGCLVEFLDKDHLVVIDKMSMLRVYHMDKNRVAKIHESRLSINRTYEPIVHMRTTDGIYCSCLKVIDEKSFIVLRASPLTSDTVKQNILLSSYKIQPDLNKQLQLSSYKQKSEADNNPSLTGLEEFGTEALIEHMSDNILGITYQRNESILFLTQSRRLMCYDMNTGKVFLLTQIGGNPVDYKFKTLKCVNQTDIALVFTGSGDRCRIFIYNYYERTLCFDSEEHLEQKIAIKEYFIYNDRIFLEYSKDGDSTYQRYFAELDPLNKILANSLSIENPTNHPIITPNGLKIGLYRNYSHRTTTERIQVFSVEQRETLYEINVQKLVPDLAEAVELTDMRSLDNRMVAFLIQYGLQGNELSRIVVWETVDRCIVSQYSGTKIDSLLGRLNNTTIIFWTES